MLDLTLGKGNPDLAAAAVVDSRAKLEVETLAAKHSFCHISPVPEGQTLQ